MQGRKKWWKHPMKGLAGMLAALVMMLGVGIGGAVPASAAEACPGKYACAYENKNWHNGGGDWAAFAEKIPNFKNYSMNDRASSVYNNGNDCAARFYQNSYYGGEELHVPKGKGYSDLSKLRMGFRTWEDKISSGRFFCP